MLPNAHIQRPCGTGKPAVCLNLKLASGIVETRPARRRAHYRNSFLLRGGGAWKGSLVQSQLTAAKSAGNAMRPRLAHLLEGLGYPNFVRCGDQWVFQDCSSCNSAEGYNPRRVQKLKLVNESNRATAIDNVFRWILKSFCVADNRAFDSMDQEGVLSNQIVPVQV